MVQQDREIPVKPSTIPFSPIESNIPALKKFLLRSFAKSTFNRSKPFPKLSTTKANIHLKPDYVTPKPAYWPATVAEHWAADVKGGIDRDVDNGVMRWVPLNEACEWCARMVVVKKKDGRPRRTVDYQELNKQCLREPYHCESPFHTARRIPENSWKSVVDAVDGYHSVELDEASSKLTTFISPWGRLRYLRFPQGHCAAGDAFNGRVQQILSNTPRFVRIVDDICIYDQSIEDHFWHTWDLFTTCAKNGIVLNESKFQFCSLEVDFAGLAVTRQGVRPSKKILQAIQDFPPPTDITKARGFFGLVNQVQWAYANSDRMAPFRSLVKPNSSFAWSAEHKQLFDEAKRKIIEQVEAGVRQYSTKRATCLQTDFCKDGIGYLLLQKFCDCQLDKAPLCCPEGWKIVFAGSRFTKGAEARYAPTEGEALAVAWALNHAHIFTRGCPNLIISTDHKPLLGILNDKPLEDIKNPRILRLKEQTLHFNFTMKYNQGKWHRAPDALSRNPTPSLVSALEVFSVGADNCVMTHDDAAEAAFAIFSPFTSLTLDDVRKATLSDDSLHLLKAAILKGFSGSDSQHTTDPSIRSYFNARENLWVEDNLVMFKNRIVIPQALRQQVLKSLHSAHQGVEGMRARATECVYWPGINASIAQVRENCRYCDSIAPSQPRQPLQPLPPSTYPFQYVCADFFELRRNPYLVVVDKFSGWPILFHFKTSPKSKHLIDSLRQVFHTYGAPMKLYSDGGLNFVSQETQLFLKNWGVEHVVSSAHYPQSNGRAELAVKSAKKILDENVSRDGSMNSEATSKALLQYRNTPIKGLGLSPSQILFHRTLRDALPTRVTLLRPHKQWIVAANNREKALQQQHSATQRRYNTFTRDLKPLSLGDKVLVQDHDGRKRWSRIGVIVERLDRSYTVRMDGSGRIVSRNRKVLRPMTRQSTDASWDPSPHPTTDRSQEDVQHPSFPICSNSTQGEDGEVPDEQSETAVTNTTVATNTSSSNGELSHRQDIPAKLPLAVRRLLPHNKLGLKE